LVGDTAPSSPSSASSVTNEGKLVVLLRPNTALVGGGEVRPLPWWVSLGCRLKRPKTLFGIPGKPRCPTNARRGRDEGAEHTAHEGKDATAQSCALRSRGRGGGRRLLDYLAGDIVDMRTTNSRPHLAQGRPHGARIFLARAVADLIINGCFNNNALPNSSASFR
jgi:hypothetical protein